MEIVNISTLAVLGYIDYRMYKIPNVILCGWIGTIVAIDSLSKVINSTTPDFYLANLFASLLVAGSFIPLRHIVKCSAGDFKLYGVLTLLKGLDDTLEIAIISILICVFPLVCGIKKVPVAFMTLYGYIAFILFIRRFA